MRAVRNLRRQLTVAVVSAVVMTSGFVFAQSSFAVHDTGMFELDGNIAHDSPTTPPYDWASLFDANGNRLVTPDPDNGPLLASTFVQDTTNPDPSYFQSNKDTLPIATWGCGPINNPTPKDNLLNAYAALVQIPATAPDDAGHTVLYMGSERASNNGTSYAGFWLFKDSSVGCPQAGPFVGHHTDGDLLVVSDYTNGGGTQDVHVYRWTGSDLTGHLVLQSSGGVCGSSSPDTSCAIANSVTITSPWAPTSHAPQTFVETGLDLTTLLGNSGGCFTNFMAETRSSDVLGATLKDFAGGEFNTCAQPPITTTATPGGALVVPGAAQHDDATIAAVGSRPAPTGTVSFFLCGPADVTSAGCPSGGTQVGSAVPITSGAAQSGDVSGATDTAVGKYCWRAEYTPDAAASGFYLPSTDTNATTECFTVAHANPTIATTISLNGTEPGTLGLTSLGDSATLSGAIGDTDGETVTFNLYGPFAAGVTPTCTAPVFTTTGPLSGGTATVTAQYTPTSAGTYVWQASYPGDALNSPAMDGCNESSESTTIVGPVISVTKVADPAGPVSAGDNIGFDITITNTPAASATDVVVTDHLPAGTDFDWSLVPPFSGCAINGAVGSQVLTCNLGTVAKGASVGPIHVQTATTDQDCATVLNTASFTSGNAGTGSDTASVVIDCASLSLSKTPDAATVDAGSPIGFTVTTSNAGPGIARNVAINDPLPAGTGVSWTIASGPGNCSISGTAPTQTLVCTPVDLASGASETVHVTSSTVFASCGIYNNTATETATNTPAPDPAHATTTVQCADLTLSKTADDASVSAGSNIGFTVTASNSGVGTAHGVVISDPLPAGSGIDWTITSGPANCSIGGTPPTQVLTCTSVDLASGATETVHITSTTVFASCGVYNNTATLTAANAPSPDPAQATTSVLCSALSLTKTADQTTVNAGDQIGFTITATNSDAAGTGTATGVVINDPLPGGAGVNWSIASGPGNCSINSTPPQKLTCTAVSLAPGASETIHVISQTAFASCATYPNMASLMSTNSPSVQANASIVVQCPLLTIAKLADAGTVSAGSNIGFTITVTNAGPGTADATTMTDPLPGGDGVDWSISPAYTGPGTCAVTGTAPLQTLACAFGNLTATTSVTVHVVSGTAFASCATYNNSAMASATNGPPPVMSSASTDVLCPDVTLTKTADAASVSAGSPIGFTVTASNSDATGTGTATGVVINDPLPGGAGVDWSIASGPSNCSITGTAPTQTLVCTAVDLAPGDSEVIHITSATAFASCASYDNTATLTLSNGPTVTAQASTAVLCPALTLTKTADAASVNEGNPVGFTVSVTNTGVGVATGVVVNDPLPGASGVSWSIDPAYTGPGTCAISGTNPQVLKCQLGNLAAGATVSVHITSATTSSSCGDLNNTATLTATNAPGSTASAKTHVACSGALAATGAGPLGSEIRWGLVFVVIGGLLTFAAGRRRRGEHRG